ncbi:MAG TPA: family 16 glycosylhydrolase [Puia sp.]|jgi:beta-glucanase (GH16 family)|nr:family 16 glycosylhydrolase [Puia sp.]
MSWSKHVYGLVFFGMVACSKGGSKGGPPAEPSVKVSDVSASRQAQATAFRFYIDLSAASQQKVSVQYATTDGTAKAGVDYTAVSGTVSIPAGQTETYVDVQVTGDSLRRTDQSFYMQLSTPVNCTLGTAQATGTIVNSDLLYLPTDTTGYSTPASYPGYHLAWSDEFNGNAVSTQNWTYDIGNNNGWGNNELENYTSSTNNAFVSAGNLIIEARNESNNGFNYSSARLKTEGIQQFTYGRIDIRAKVPVAHGMWPALWMLGSDIGSVNWPGCGETDIMELVGSNPNRITGSMHWQNSDGSEGTYNNNYYLSAGDFSQQFHVFSLLWQHDTVQFFVDDSLYVNGSINNVTTGTYPFNLPFFFIFNVAVGGNWPGPPDNTTVFPQRMFVDYVRVFQQ